MSYKKNIASNFIAQIIRILLGFITSILVARKLGAEGKGYISYIILIFGLIASYGHFGINNATAYFQKRSKYSQNEVFNNNISVLLIIFGIIFFLIISLKLNSLILKEYDFDLVFLGLAYVLITFIMTSVQEFYVGNERILEINKYLLIGESLILITTLVLSFTNTLSIRSYLIIFVFSTLIRMIFLLKGIRIKFTFYINKILVKEEIRFGFIAYLSALFIFLNYRADQFLIKMMLGIDSLGIYSIAVNLAELAFLVPTSVSNVLTGRLYNINNQVENKKNVTYKTVKYTFYISMVVVFIGMIMTPLIPIVYGKGFSDAANITLVLFIGIIFASIGKVAYTYFFTEGRPIIHLKVTAITFLTNISFNFILIPFLGMIGAAIASTISYFIYGFLYLVIFVKKEGFTLRELLVPERQDIGALLESFNRIKQSKKVIGKGGDGN